MAGIAETAKMLAQLDFKDNLSKGVGQAIKSVDKLDSKFGKVGAIASKGFRTLGTNLKNLITGPVGILGLGAGVFALTNFIKGSVDKAREFGETVFKVKAIIGGATEDVSKLVDVLGDYGIESDDIVRIGGMFEKNIGNIAKNAKTAAKFQKDYGFSILDSAGHAKDFNTVLLEAADIFTSKTIPQSQKAAILSKLYGRNWQELVPILSKGRAELEKTLDQGITLTDKQAKAMERARVAGIKWEDAIGDLQTMIGIELLPSITKLVERLTRFVQAHSQDIIKFFKDAAKFAQGMGQAIKNDVLPFIQKIGDIWSGIPDDLKKVLIGGFVINKATGGALTGIVSELGKGLIKGVLGITAGVVNINAAKVLGGGGSGVPAAAAPAAAAGGLGAVGIGAAAGLIAGPIVQQLSVNDANAELYAAGFESKLQAMQNAWDFGALINNLGVVGEGIDKLIAGDDLSPKPTAGDKLISRTVEESRADNIAHINKVVAGTSDIEAAQQRASRTNIAHLNRVVAGTQGVKQATQLTRASVLATKSAVQSGSNSTARNLDQVESVIRNKKLAVKVNQNQRQSLTAIATANSTGAKASGGADDTVVRRTSSQLQNIDRYLAKGAVGLATQPTRAIFGEAGNEAFAILRNPRSGTLGGGAPHIVNVTVNIDPRRITKKQTSSGIYKTYVAT